MTEKKIVEFVTGTEDETVALGRRLGTMLKAGDVVCLNGDLGTGKTAFTHGIAAALGITGYITSPTFTIVNEYSSDLPLYHFDVYRIADPEEMFEIGFDEYLSGDGIVVIEWADIIEPVLPDEHIRVDISKDRKDLSRRIIRMEFRGSGYTGRFDGLAGHSS